MIFRTFSSFDSMQSRCGSNCAFTKWRNERSGKWHTNLAIAVRAIDGSAA